MSKPSRSARERRKNEIEKHQAGSRRKTDVYADKRHDENRKNRIESKRIRESKASNEMFKREKRAMRVNDDYAQGLDLLDCPDSSNISYPCTICWKRNNCTDYCNLWYEWYDDLHKYWQDIGIEDD